MSTGIIIHPFNEALASNLQQLEDDTELSAAGKKEAISRAMRQLWSFPGATEILGDMEVAVAQAVAFAEYVHDHAKGRMEQAAAQFLSLPFSQEIKERLDKTKEMSHVFRVVEDQVRRN